MRNTVTANDRTSGPNISLPQRKNLCKTANHKERSASLAEHDKTRHSERKLSIIEHRPVVACGPAPSAFCKCGQTNRLFHSNGVARRQQKRHRSLSGAEEYIIKAHKRLQSTNSPSISRRAPNTGHALEFVGHRSPKQNWRNADVVQRVENDTALHTFPFPFRTTLWKAADLQLEKKRGTLNRRSCQKS